MAHYPRKIGFYSIRYHARLMCKFIGQFTPVIIQFFPDSPALHAALSAANAACEVLVQQIDLNAHEGV